MYITSKILSRQLLVAKDDRWLKGQIISRMVKKRTRALAHTKEADKSRATTV